VSGLDPERGQACRGNDNGRVCAAWPCATVCSLGMPSPMGRWRGGKAMLDGAGRLRLGRRFGAIRRRLRRTPLGPLFAHLATHPFRFSRGCCSPFARQARAGAVGCPRSRSAYRVPWTIVSCAQHWGADGLFLVWGCLQSACFCVSVGHARWLSKTPDSRGAMNRGYVPVGFIAQLVAIRRPSRAVP